MSKSYFKQRAYKRSKGDDRNSRYGVSYSLLSVCDEDCEDVSEDRTLLFKERRPPQRYFEHKIKPGETLQSLALRFNCSVAQLKQANNIIRENEVFALRKVRIPLTPLSSVRDEVASIHGRSKSVSEQDDGSKLNDQIVDCSVNDDLQSTENSDIEVASNHGNTSENNQSDDGLCNPLSAPVPQSLVLIPELVPELDLPQVNIDQRRSSNIFDCSGADAGLSWPLLVFCSLLLGFFGPLIYIFYIYEHEKRHQNETSV